MYPKDFFTSWNPDGRLLVTRLSGNVNIDEIHQWRDSIDAALTLVAPGTAFKTFVNIHGFKATDFDAHKAFRTIIPTMLARYDFRVGYLNLFDNAVAHSHHDTDKMHLYQTQCSRPNDQYFTDPAAAEYWIRSYQPEEQII
jgi:hypothetical protein